ncbi:MULTISPECIES: glycosyltransferase family 2 protein [Pseudomonas]|uniref:glycosyltransferase family 2 protein n=1 Tax=Pseudomonas TaxID=286 RepID=UPI0006CCCB94|nr:MULTISPECIES: glycosyltransferase family A protein [Pseudomonas]KPG83213.1 glycosyl transferase [Pseudomonas sp. RIT-PI-o]PWB38140.1 glycosyltransferase family 2 protein [Pseudomonas sp. NDM]UST59385.1 glycosyltransferase family 2 protein [Pseudomonas moraviensis]WPC29936.1 glycosyltransferase family 2 protein [Pseudomonas moraviensis]SDU73550.1 Glycosyl transferase family 2 [Pseudomonas moraviensis]
MTETLISVVIPAYNYARSLPRAVESVLAQLHEAAADLLVIDDGSTDTTPEVLDRLLVEHAGRFRAIRQSNGGLSCVRNRGIEETSGRFLVFLDADDEMAAGALAALARHIASNPETRMIIGAHWSVFSGGKRSLQPVKPLPATVRQRVKGYLLDKTVSISNGACAMHREVFAPGNYPEQLRNVEDLPVFAQVLARFPCSVLQQPLALIYKHADSMRHDLHQSLAAGTEQVVSEVFSSRRMPQEFHDLRQAYLAQRCLSLFRDCYSHREYALAKTFYMQALRADWHILGRWSYLRKALRLLFR